MEYVYVKSGLSTFEGFQKQTNTQNKPNGNGQTLQLHLSWELPRSCVGPLIVTDATLEFESSTAVACLHL